MTLCNTINIREMEDHKLFQISAEKEIYRAQKIAQGSYGWVYRGIDQLNKRVVALKYIKDASWVNEVQTMKLLTHPNIVQYFDHVPCAQIEANTSKEGCYIIMEFVDGINLGQMLKDQKFIGEGLPQILILKLFSQMISAFALMHQQGIVHRDIKPENILIDKNKNIKIVDMGQSKQRNLMQTYNQGTPLYNAPEVFNDENPQDFRRDVWSLGLVLYEMLTGELFFEDFLGKQKQNVSIQALKNYVREKKHKVTLKNKLDPFWLEILHKMIQKNYQKRKHMHQIKLLYDNEYDHLKKRIEGKYLWKTVRQVRHQFLETDLLTEPNDMKLSEKHAAITKCRMYLKYFYQKNRFLVILGELFSTKKYPLKYPFLPTLFKIAIVFLCYEIYLASIKSMLSNLKNECVKISLQEKYSSFQFEEPYKKQLLKYITSYRAFYEEEVSFFSGKLKEKVIPFFRKCYNSQQYPINMGFPQKKQTELSLTRSRKTQDQNKIRETQQAFESGRTLEEEKPNQILFENFQDLRQLLLNYGSKTKLNGEKYYQIYKNLINSKIVYQSNEDLQKYFYSGDLGIYYLLKIIANLDKLYKWEDVRNGSELMEKDYDCIKYLEKKAMRQIFLQKVKVLNEALEE